AARAVAVTSCTLGTRRTGSRSRFLDHATEPVSELGRLSAHLGHFAVALSRRLVLDLALRITRDRWLLSREAELAQGVARAGHVGGFEAVWPIATGVGAGTGRHGRCFGVTLHGLGLAGNGGNTVLELGLATTDHVLLARVRKHGDTILRGSRRDQAPSPTPGASYRATPVLRTRPPSAERFPSKERWATVEERSALQCRGGVGEVVAPAGGHDAEGGAVGPQDG